jgi:hypothetical protein
MQEKEPFLFGEIKKASRRRLWCSAGAAVGHRRLKEIIFEYQSVAVMNQIDSQDSCIRQWAAVNLAAFNGAFGSRVAAVRGVEI